MSTADASHRLSDTRGRIVEAADRLFYQRGFEATSFADIARAVSLSRGNFYYHFRTKDEILGAVIALRLARTTAMLEAWEVTEPDAAARILRFVEILVTNRTDIMAHGCPVGTLCNELAKLDHAAQDAAAAVFALFRGWLARQFTALGRGSASDALALHLLMRSQGVATLATAFREEDFIEREVETMRAWVQARCRDTTLPATGAAS